METVELIEQLINKLDTSEDSLLILYLKDTLNKKTKDYLKEHTIVEIDLKNAKSQLQRILRVFMLDEQKRNKISSILERSFDCDSCKFNALTEEHEACKRHNHRAILLRIKRDSLFYENDDFINQFLANPENEMLLKCKAIFSKINRKIKNYETSKH